MLLEQILRCYFYKALNNRFAENRQRSDLSMERNTSPRNKNSLKLDWTSDFGGDITDSQILAT